MPPAFFDVHAAPWFGLPSHTPTHGAPGVPEQIAPFTAARQVGHGAVGKPVRTVAEFSWKFHDASPVPMSSVPLGATGENVFVTQTDRPAFEMGSGTPNLHPMSVQSTPAGVDPDAVGPMLQFVPVQPDSVKRFVAPAGVALSGTCERPPPSDRLPQRSFLSGIVPARSRKVLPQSPLPVVERKSKRSVVVVVGAGVDVEVDVELLVLELLELDVLLELDEVVPSELDELVELDVLVELDELLDEVEASELDVLVVELVDVDELVEDKVLVELLVLEDVVVVLGVSTKATRSSTQSSTRFCRVNELPVGGPQSLPLLFSSL